MGNIGEVLKVVAGFAIVTILTILADRYLSNRVAVLVLVGSLVLFGLLSQQEIEKFLAWARENKHIAIVGCVVVFALVGFVVGNLITGKASVPTGTQEDATKQNPYHIDIDVTLLSPTRQQDCGWWLVSPVGPDYIVSPVNIALHLAVVNLQSAPTMIRDLKVEMKTASGLWAQLFRLNTLGNNIYFGGSAGAAAQVSDTRDNSVLFDRLVYERSLESNKPVMGWLLFEYPKGYGPTFLGEYKVTIHDDTGVEYVSPVLSSMPGAGNTGMQGGAIPFSAGRIDLSQFKAVYRSDNSPFKF